MKEAVLWAVIKSGGSLSHAWVRRKNIVNCGLEVGPPRWLQVCGHVTDRLVQRKNLRPPRKLELVCKTCAGKVFAGQDSAKPKAKE
jgi:hypothetical protein